MRKPTLIFISIFLWSLAGVSAEPSASRSKTKKKNPPISDRTKDDGFLKKTFLDTNEMTARAVDKLSNKIDMALAGERTTRERTKTKLVVRNDFYSVEGDSSIDHRPRFDVKLNLPNLEEKWSLTFSSYDDDNEERGINKRRLKTAPQRENYGASVVLLKKLGDIDFTFRPKLQVEDRRLTTSHLLRFESVADMRTYLIRPRLELFARADSGTGELFAIDFEYEINKTFTVALTNEEEYIDFQNLFSTNHELALLQEITDRKTLKYATLFESNNNPNFHLEKYSVYLLYRELLYKDKLHYSLSPRLIYAEDNHFSQRLAFVLGIDLIF